MKKDMDDWLKGEARQEPLLVAPITIVPRQKNEGFPIVPLQSPVSVQAPVFIPDAAKVAEAEEDAEKMPPAPKAEAQIEEADEFLEYPKSQESPVIEPRDELTPPAPAADEASPVETLETTDDSVEYAEEAEAEEPEQPEKKEESSAEGNAYDEHYANDDEIPRLRYAAVRESVDERLRRISEMRRAASSYYKRASSRSNLGRFVTVCVVLILVAGTAFALYRHMKSNSYENLMGKAQSLYQSEQYEPALNAYKDAAERHPEMVEPILGVAHSAERVGHVEEAIGAYKASLEHFSIDAVLHRSQVFYEIGRLYTLLKAWDKAQENFEITLAIDAVNYAASFALGGALEEQGKADEAIDAYKRALELSPSSDAAQEAIRRVSSLLPPKETDPLAQAKQKYDHAIQVGGVALNLKRYGEASDYFAEALAIRSDDAVAWAGFAEARANLGDLAGGIKSMERALERDPNLSGAKSRLEEMKAQEADRQ